MNKAFFFDRDGVLNNMVYRHEEEYGTMMDCAPLNTSELEINKNAKKIIDYTKNKGFFPIIITNQPDYLKKNILLKTYEDITTKLCQELELDRSQILECFHKEGFSLECKCRKPAPGLFLMAKGLYNLNLKQSWMLGDSWKDIKAAENAGIENTVFLKRGALQGKNIGNKEHEIKMLQLKLKPKYFINNLLELIDILK